MSAATKSGAASARQTRVLAAVGLALVVASFGLLLREAFTAGQAVAELTITVDEILPSTHGYLVSLVIENRGKATATALVVEGTLKRSGTDVEKSVVTLDYVAAGSRRDAALFFASDPRRGELTVRPTGYIEP